MEKRIYNIEDMAKIGVEIIKQYENNDIMAYDSWMEKFDSFFKNFGQPYEPTTPPATTAPVMENKRIYTEKDVLRFVHYCLYKMDEFDLSDEDIKKYFYDFGHSYELATPSAPSMSDEDKVWMAAVEFVQHVNYSDAVNDAFKLLDEFRRQQKEREGKK